VEKNVFKKHAKLMGSIWDKAKKKADSGQIGDIFEDGRYKMGVTDATTGESKKGDFMLTLSLAFLEGEYVGKTKKIYRVITPDKAEDNLARILLDINRLGYEVEDFEQIESACEEIRKARPVVRVTLKTRPNSDYQDGYIEKTLTGEEAENTPGEEAAPEESVPAQEAEATLEVGMTVVFEYKGKELQGEVKEILEDDGKVKVKAEKMVYTVAVDKLSLPADAAPAEEAAPEEVPEEPQEEPEAEPEPEEKKPAKIVKKVGKLLKKK
jgi:hypothetical protein